MHPITLSPTPVPPSLLTSPAPLSPLHNTSILITGGASGLGATLARTLASAGARITIADTNTALGTSLASSLTAAGHAVHFVPTDVRIWASNVAAFRAAVRHGGGRLDHVVLNAGVMDTPFFTGESARARHVDDEGEDGGLLVEPENDARVLDVCVKGTMFGLKLARVFLTMEGVGNQAGESGKSVLFTLSPECYISLPGSVSYGGGKFGARGLWRAGREMFAGLGIRCNGLVPWLLDTPFNAAGPIKDILLAFDIHTTPLQTHVDVAMHLLGDKNMAGRAVAVGQPGGSILDIEDDEVGGDGSKKYWEMLHKDLPGVREKLAKMYGLMGFNVDVNQSSCF